MKERQRCEYKGCKLLGRNKGKYKDHTIYDRFCDAHHRIRYDKAKIHFSFKQFINNDRCDRCGWDKAPCDRHRIDPKKGYTRSNILILCPNCHRVEETNKK